MTTDLEESPFAVADREAREFLGEYDGTFEFLVDLRSRIAHDPGYELSIKQTEAILRCRDHERAKAAEPAFVPARFAFPSGTHFYAVRNDGGGITFLRITECIEGRWAGWTFVDQVIGGQPSAPIGRQRPGQGYTGQVAHLIERAADDPWAAMALYGQEIGSCGVCGKVLTDATSRELGIGPVCRDRS